MYGVQWSWRGAVWAGLRDLRERAPQSLATIRPTAWPKGIGAREGVAAAAMVLALAACSTIDDIFDSSPPPANSKSGDYPKLNTVPGRPDRPTPPAGLSGDRSNARYTDSDVKPVNEAANSVVGQQLGASTPPAAGTVSAGTVTAPSGPVPNSVQPAPLAPAPAGQSANQPAVQPARNTVANAPVAAPPAMAPTAASGPVGLPAPIPPSATQLVLPSPSGSRAGAPTPQLASNTPNYVPASGQLLEVAVVQFGRSSSGLDGSALSVLRDVAAIQRSQGGVIRIVGHASADSANPDPERARQDSYNVSLARANAVARQLAALGVPRNQIVVEGAADDAPQYAPLTAAAAAANRRAEIYLDL